MPSRRRPDPEPTLSVSPNQLHLGDRFTNEDGEWKIATRPVTYRQESEVRANVQRPGNPATKKEAYWPAHEKITVRRESAGRPGSDDDAHGDELRAELRRLRGEVRRLDEEKRGLEERITALMQELEKTRSTPRPRR